MQHLYCRVPTGFSHIPKDVPTNAKSGDGSKISLGLSQIDFKIPGYDNFRIRLTNP